MLLLAAVVFCLVKEKFETCRWWRWSIGGLLVMVLAVVLYATLANRSGDHMQPPNLIPFHSYREVMNGGHPELYRSNFMNVALFYPAGLLAVTLLPKKWPAWCRCIPAVILLCAVSVGIEYVQYRFSLGQVEIDDVIHNTLGALAGSVTGVTVPCLIGVMKKMLAKAMAEFQTK